MRKLLLLTFTVFFLFSFLTTNGQNPTVTINQSAAQVDPTNLSPIYFTAVFDQPVINFATGDVTITGTAGGTTGIVTGGPTTYAVAVSGMINCGTVIVNIPAGVCTNTLFQPNLASTSIDNTVTFSQLTNPTVTINQAATQPDPTSVSPINFTVVFDQAVIGFATGDVTLSGTAGATTGIVSGSGTTYNVAVSGMTASGTVIATIAAGVSQNTCTQPNNASTSTDNTVIVTCVPPVVNVTPATSCGGVPGIGGPCNALTANGNADTYVWSPQAGLYMDCQMTIPYAGANTTIVYAAPTVYTVYTVTGTIIASGCSSAATTRVNYTPPPPIVNPNPAFMCLNGPAIPLIAGTANTIPFCSALLNIPVPDNDPAGASSNIIVSGMQPGCIITGMTVRINMQHTRIGNMVFVLKAPNGMVLNLDYYLSATGGSGPGSGFVNTIFSSSGTTLLSAGTDPYTGTFKADAQSIAAGGFGLPGPTGMQPTAANWASLFTGSVNGNWTLGFYDGITGDVGTLTYWCLGINYSCGPGIPSSPAIWSPAAGLYLDATTTAPYVPGTQTNIVWARPIAAGTYTYQAVTQSLPTTLCSPATNFINTNGNATVTFNVRNNHPYPIVLSQIDSRTLVVNNNAWVTAFYKTTAIAGSPGAISSANGWNQFATAVISGTGTSVQPFLTNLQLTIPPGATYGMCIQSLTATNASNLAYSALNPGTYSFNDGGCEIITGTNIGYSGANIPAAPTTTLSGFIGKLYFLEAPATCTSLPTNVVVTVGGLQITVTTQPANQIICTDGIANFTVAATGGGTLSYQWQVSNGSTYTNIVNGGVYSGATTAALTVTAPPVSMSGYYYRVFIFGTTACAAVASQPAILTIKPLPVVTITASPLVIGPGETTTIFSTVTPNPAAIYTWYYNGAVLPGAGADTLLVDINGLGDYQLKVTDVNGCSNLSNIITIAHSFALTLFTYPNPSGGIFQVRYYSEANNAVQRSLIVYDNMGNKVITRNFTQTIPYQKIDIDIRAHGKGLYWIELRDANGKRLAMNRAVVQ